MKPILILLLLIPFSYSFAQNEKEKKYKWGCGVAINSVEAQIGIPLQSSWGNAAGNLSSYGDKKEKSLSLSVIPKYIISDNFILRFEFGVTDIQLKIDEDVSGEFYRHILEESLNQQIYRFIPGIQWNIVRKKNLELHCGAFLNYSHYSISHYSFYGENRQVPSDSLTYWVRYQVDYPGGFTCGIGAISGFNVYIQKHISLGAEFSSSISYNKIGGAYSFDGTTQSLPNAPTTLEKTSSSSLFKGFEFSKILSSFNMAVWF